MLDNEEYAHGRRRSVDVGGLALALENQGLGHGWGGWDQVRQGETRYAHFSKITLTLLIHHPSYAELLCEVRAQTQTTVTHYDTDPYVYRNHWLSHPVQCISRSPIEIPPETRKRLIRRLDGWHFEPHKLPDEEVLFCAQILFETLFQMENMQNDTGVSLSQCHMCLVTFHVPHALMLTQMTYQSF